MELSLQIWTRHSLSKGLYAGVKRRSNIKSIGECKQKILQKWAKVSVKSLREKCPYSELF